jgi:uncharacterized protein (TIGR02145 family)
MRIFFSLIFSLNLIQAQIKDVKIGTQVWMAENLNVFYFKNGDAIPVVKTNDEWEIASKKKQPACCFYENQVENGNTYGVLYNWYAVNDPRGLAPIGYHIPSDAEWAKLNAFLGGKNKVAKKMKSTNGWPNFEAEVECNECISWTPEQKAGLTCSNCNDSRKIKGQKSGNGSNESGFNALPGGYRDNDGTFFTYDRRYYLILQNYGQLGGFWWSSSQSNPDYVWGNSLYYNNDFLIRTPNIKGKGGAVRCIKN